MPETPEQSTRSQHSQAGPPPGASPDRGGPPGRPPDEAGRREPPWKRRWWLFAGVLAAVVLAAVYAVHYFSYAATHPNMDDAAVSGDTVAINSKLAARVAQVYVNGDQRVHPGQLLVTLVPSE